MDEAIKQKLCQFCLENTGKYVCPRCNLFYCSVPCYQSPNHVRCSEEFYKDSVFNELKSSSDSCINIESRKKVMEMLSRINTNNIDKEDEEEENGPSDSDGEGEEEADLIKRLEGINLDDPDLVWSRLNGEEKHQFKKLLESGDVTDVLPETVPWWICDRKKVVELDDMESNFIKKVMESCPNIDTIVSFSTISKKTPSPSVVYNLANVISTYVFVFRYYNGDHLEFYKEATTFLIILSKNLSDNQNFDDIENAMASVIQEVMNNENNLFHGKVININDIKKDVYDIFNGPHMDHLSLYLLSALSEICFLLKKSLNNDIVKGSLHFPNGYSEFSRLFSDSNRIRDLLFVVKRQKIKLCVKKIEYYMSWTKHFYSTPPPFKLNC